VERSAIDYKPALQTVLRYERQSALQKIIEISVSIGASLREKHIQIAEMR
jgi:hypothetical protein